MSRVIARGERGRRPSRPRWSRKADLDLLEGQGSFTVRTVEKRTGRTRKAIYGRLLRAHGGGGMSRGNYTLDGAIEESGYSRTQLLRARRALGQAWLRTSKRGRWILTLEQFEALTEWLKRDFWCVSLRLTECLRCRTRKQPHHRNGLCTSCYWPVRAAAVQAGLRMSVRALAAETERLLPSAAPSDAALLKEYLAQLGRNLALLEAEIRQLARIRQLHRIIATSVRR